MTFEREIDEVDVARSICDSEGLVLGDCLGRGAFKTVYRVEGADGSVYALKIIRGRASSPRTVREARAIRRCDHCCIARLHRLDSHAYQGVEYDFTLEEYIDGGTLTGRLEEEQRIDDEAVIALGERLIDAVAHLATLNLVHRDIKPDNIMFRAESEIPVLVDFGLVRDLAAPSLTPTELMRGPGTPYFAAPEQLNNEKHLIDWRTDQFSLGVALFFARFTAHPYQQRDEPTFSPETVERVALRQPRGDILYASLRDSKLRCLEQMTEAWPVQRFRRPHLLARAWQAQGSNRP